MIVDCKSQPWLACWCQVMKSCNMILHNTCWPDVRNREIPRPDWCTVVSEERRCGHCHCSGMLQSQRDCPPAGARETDDDDSIEHWPADCTPPTCTDQSLPSSLSLHRTETTASCLVSPWPQAWSSAWDPIWKQSGIQLSSNGALVLTASAVSSESPISQLFKYP